MSFLATFLTGCWPVTIGFKMTVSLAVEAADRVGDVRFHPDQQVTNLKCFRKRWVIERNDKGASGFSDTLPEH